MSPRRDAARRASASLASVGGTALDLQDAISTLGQDSERFPLYCALLYTGEPGPDQRVAAFVRSNLLQLDALTGSKTAWLVIDDQIGIQNSLLARRIYGPDEPRPRFRVPPDPSRGVGAHAAEVYRAAELLDVSVAELPCVVFFVDPAHTSETFIVPLGRFLEGLPGAETGTDLLTAFRCLAAAATSVAGEKPKKRLRALQDAVERERDRAGGVSSAGSGRAESWGRIGSTAKTLLETLAAALALATM